MKKLWRMVGRDSKGRRITGWDFGDTLEDAKKKMDANDFVSFDDELCCEVDPATGERTLRCGQ